MPAEFAVRDFGATGDGSSLDTTSIQKAVDSASAAGGGTVTFDAGRYRTGTIVLQDNITLHIGPGARLEASTDIADYIEMEPGHNVDRQPFHLIVADGCANVAITGTGSIAGNGPAFWYPRTGPGARPGNYKWHRSREQRVSPLIEFVECSNARIADITIRDSPGWTCHFNDCDHVLVRGVRIINDLFGPNTDGIDINGCRDVLVSDCVIETGDDAIVLKTTPGAPPCERVMISNCAIKTNCVAVKLGATESYNDIRDVVVSNCTIHGSNRGIGLYSLNGGTFENVTVMNVVCDTNNGMILNLPVHLDLRTSGTDRQGTIRHIRLTNVLARTSGRILMTAQAGTTIHDVTLRDIVVEYRSIEDAASLADEIQSGTGTYSNFNPAARRANATVVAENISSLGIDNLVVHWPESPEPDYAHVWLRGVRESWVRLRRAQPSRPGARIADASGCDVDVEID